MALGNAAHGIELTRVAIVAYSTQDVAAARNQERAISFLKHLPLDQVGIVSIQRRGRGKLPDQLTVRGLGEDLIHGNWRLTQEHANAASATASSPRAR
jgi:hypothetical protein